MPRLTTADQEMFYLLTCIPLLPEKGRQDALRTFLEHYTKSKNQNTIHPITEQSLWGAVLAALYKGPCTELCAIVLRMTKGKNNFNELITTKEGDYHGVVLLANVLFREGSIEALSDASRWNVLDHVLKTPDLNLTGLTPQGKPYSEHLLDIVWRHKNDSRECNKVMETLRQYVGVELGNPVAWFNESDVQIEAKRVEKGTQQRYLLQMLKSGMLRKVYGRPSYERVEALRSKFPNFSIVIETLLPEIALHKISAKQLFQCMPLLLVGDPGIGKTRFVRALADALDLEFHRVDCGGVTSTWAISGASGTWKDAKPGTILTHIQSGQSINPVIMLDELDKMGGDSSHDPFGVFHTLLEAQTAASFKDECVGVPINASHISWVATANSANTLPKTIVSRFRVLQVPSPSKAELPTIVDSIYEDLLADNKAGWGSRFSPVLNTETRDAMTQHSPRDMSKILRTACGIAAGSRDEEVFNLTPRDLELGILNAQVARNKIGFTG